MKEPANWQRTKNAVSKQHSLLYTRAYIAKGKTKNHDLVVREASQNLPPLTICRNQPCHYGVDDEVVGIGEEGGGSL